MAERALLSPDELKNLPKGNFIVMKTGVHPMRTKLQLYLDATAAAARGNAVANILLACVS